MDAAESFSLLVALVNRFTGTVKTEWQPLFNGGAPYEGSTETVTFIAHQSVRQPCYVVVRGEGSVGAQSQPVAVWRANLLPRLQCQATLSVASANAVRLQLPAGTAFEEVPLTHFSLAEFEGSIPTQISPNTSGLLDLAIILDRITKEEAGFRTRVDIAQALLGRLTEEFALAGSLRAALLVVADHIHPTAEHAAAAQLPPPVACYDFADPPRVVGHLSALESAFHHAYDLPGAIEEAVTALGNLQWRNHSHHVTLILASRPPHPPSAGAHELVPAATEHAKWEERLKTYDTDCGMHRFLVTFPSDWPISPLPREVAAYLRNCWASLAPEESSFSWIDQARPPDEAMALRSHPVDDVLVNAIVQRMLHCLALDSTSLPIPELAAQVRIWRPET